MQAGTLITGAIVMTMDAERRVIRDGAVAFTGDTIVAVGKSANLAWINAREVVNGSRFVLTAGVVNCHVHITETLGRWVIPLYYIEGIPRAESDALLGCLFAHVQAPMFQYGFAWQPHSAIWDYFPQARSGFRVKVMGDVPL